MDGIGILIMLILGIMFGPPVVFFIVGLKKRSTNREASTVFFILGVAWLVIGGGICASILTQG
jgi:hypothetical protein